MWSRIYIFFHTVVGISARRKIGMVYIIFCRAQVCVKMTRIYAARGVCIDYCCTRVRRWIKNNGMLNRLRRRQLWPPSHELYCSGLGNAAWWTTRDESITMRVFGEICRVRAHCCARQGAGREIIISAERKGWVMLSEGAHKKLIPSKQFGAPSILFNILKRNQQPFVCELIQTMSRFYGNISLFAGRGIFKGLKLIFWLRGSLSFSALPLSLWLLK